MLTQPSKEAKINVITLGCSKNLVDSENLMTQLRANDIEVIHEGEQDTDIVIVNTCGFIENAKEESIQTILEQVRAKEEGRIKELYVTGCLSERYKPDLEKEIPNVDAYFGTHDLQALLKELGTDYKHELLGERKTSTPQHYAYLKISEGCNRTCGFCAIPLMRGKHESRPIEELVQEATNLARDGVKELMLIAQELTYYGLDIYKERRLPELLRALSAVEGIEWIRLHYAYPSGFPLDILDAMREESSICNYLDIPLQHIADPVLKSMRRQITKAETIQLMEDIRLKVPDIRVRTTMLVGFPGETEEDFEELLEFVAAQRFERLGVFTYSHEDGTRAFGLDDDVPEKVKQERASRLMELQQEISAELNQEYVGKTLKVLVDRKEGNYFVGRTEYDSPEVDNEVLVDAREYYLRVGDFADITITAATEFDLQGVPA